MSPAGRAYGCLRRARRLEDRARHSTDPRGLLARAGRLRAMAAALWPQGRTT